MNIPPMLKTCLFALCPLLLAAPLPTHADDADAWRLVREADSCGSSIDDLQRAFVALFDAYGTADSSDTRDTIQKRIDNLYPRYLNGVRDCYPLFLDAPIDSDYHRKLYNRLARFKDARGMRLLGEQMIEEGDNEGWDYVEQAAASSEPRALFLLALRYKTGRGNATRDGAKAFEKLNLSARLGYAPAYEMLAQIQWDGDGNFGGNVWNQAQAISNLDAAIREYGRWKMNDAGTQRQLESLLERLRSIRVHMQNLSSGRVSLINGFYATYDALMLSTFHDTTDAGLRARAYYICREMEEFGVSYLIDHFNCLKLEYVPIHIGNYSDKDWLGLCTACYQTDGTYSFNIKVDSSKLYSRPQQSDSLSQWYGKLFAREMQLNNTIAHELAHGYFRSRYPQISEFSDEDRKLTYEGHATNSAYAVIRKLYYNFDSTRLTPQQYTERFCSTEYTRYFNWFRNNCMSPSDRVFWDKIDRWERNSGSENYEPRLLNQVCDGEESYWAPSYFRRGFFGYM